MLKLCLSLLLSAGFIFQWILLWLIFSNFIWFLLIWSFFFQRFINKCANFFFFFTSSHPIVVDDAIIFVPDQTGKNHHMKWPDADIYGNTRNLYWVFGQITLPLDGRQRQQKRDIYRYRNLFGWTSISVGRPHWWVLFIVLLHVFWYGRKYPVLSMSHEIWLKRFLH